MQGCAPPRGPIFFNFMQFLKKKIDQIIAFHIHLWSWRPLLEKILDPPLTMNNFSGLFFSQNSFNGLLIQAVFTDLKSIYSKSRRYIKHIFGTLKYYSCNYLTNQTMCH